MAQIQRGDERLKMKGPLLYVSVSLPLFLLLYLSLVLSVFSFSVSLCVFCLRLSLYSRRQCVLSSQSTGCKRDCTPTAEMNEVLKAGYAGWDGEFT